MLPFREPQKTATESAKSPDVFEAQGAESVFSDKDHAIDYAQNRASFRSGEIRILDSTGDLRDHAAESTAAKVTSPRSPW
jgi:hypothetical protein